LSWATRMMFGIIHGEPVLICAQKFDESEIKNFSSEQKYFISASGQKALAEFHKDSNEGSHGIIFEVGGDMKMDGIIQADKGSTIVAEVKGNYTSNKGKIIQGGTEPKEWHQKPFGQIIIGLIIAVGAGTVLYFFGI